MVAEPVKATVEYLKYYYENVADYISGTKDSSMLSLDKLNEAISAWNPFNVPNITDSVQLKKDDSLWDSLSRDKAFFGCFISVGLGVSSYFAYKCWNKPISIGNTDFKSHHRRKVPRLPNGARRDVILVIGSPTEPLTRLIALDFEKRGFIVYLTIFDEKDLRYVESNPITDDINFLNLNKSYSYEIQIAKFKQLLEVPVVPFQGAQSHQLRLMGVVFTPSLYFPIGPIENVSIAAWDRILSRLTITFKFFSSGLLQIIRSEKNCKLISITSNIISSMELPYHAPETLYQKSVESFFTSLTREVAHHNISITQVKLGNLNINNQKSSSNAKITSLVNSEIRSWNEDIRRLYANNFTKSQYKSNPFKSNKRDANLRDLHHLLFDLIYSNGKNPQLVYCGSGARTYEWVSRILPDSLISWILK